MANQMHNIVPLLMIAALCYGAYRLIRWNDRALKDIADQRAKRNRPGGEAP